MRRSRGETGRKVDLIKRILLSRNARSMSIEEARYSVRGYGRKTNAELLEILKQEGAKDAGGPTRGGKGGQGR